jgi:hypothetical protein
MLQAPDVASTRSAILHWRCVHWKGSPFGVLEGFKSDYGLPCRRVEHAMIANPRCTGGEESIHERVYSAI